MPLIVDQPQLVADWVASRLGETAPTVDSAIGYESDGELRAGVYFDGLSGGNIFCHIASTTEMLPVGLLCAVAAYMFQQLKLSRATFPVDAGNEKVRTMLKGMGAEHEATLRGVYEDRDMLLYTLRGSDPYPRRLLSSWRH